MTVEVALPPPLCNDSLLTRRQVLSLTQLSSSSLWRLMKDGKFPAGTRLLGNALRWRRSDIEAWMINL